ALIPGRARGLLAELASQKWFLEATDHSVNPSRMVERELCLRFLAFRMTPPERYVSQDFDGFLRKTMHRINALSEEQVKTLSLYFAVSMKRSQRLFGKQAFRKQVEGVDRRYPINKALFEVQAVTLAGYSGDEVNALVAQADVVNEKFRKLM